MKQILFILISIAFLQAPANAFSGNTPATYAQEYMTSTDAECMQHEESDEVKTESIFYSFITKDVADGKKIKDGETLYYTKYPKANDAFNAMLNFIYPADRRTKFNKDKKYDSDLITVEWEENPAGKTVVKDGFAQIKVQFKKKKVSYTVIFRK